MSALRNIGYLIEKEWRHYFGGPIAYVAVAIWTLLFGFFYYAIFNGFVEYSVRAGAQMEFGAPKLSLNEIVIATVLRNMTVVALFILPMLTMRLFAEEKRQGTIELLATSPLTDFQLVMGKFLGALSLYVTMMLAGFVNFVLMWAYATSKPEWRPLLTGAVGLLLVGGTFIALGLFLSTLTRNQIIAGILGFGLGLVFWILSWFDQPTASPLMKAIAYAGITNHVEDLLKGVVALKDVVFYLSFITFGLFLAHQSVESQRWRA